jgi:hypothetical protein
MHGVTSALVAFILLSIAFPTLVKKPTQFYASFAMVCLIILLDAIAFMIGEGSFRVFAYLAIAVLQLSALTGLFLAAGDMTFGKMRSDMAGAIEVIRRGEESKEIIIPLRGQRPLRTEDEPVPERIELNDPPPMASESAIPIDEEPDKP